MADLEKKWDDLWKAFEATRKSEWLKSAEAGKFAAMLKEVKPMKEILKSLDLGSVDILDACGNRKGKSSQDASLYYKTYVAKMRILGKGTLKTLAKASHDDMDKATKPNTYRALKVLMTGIDEITSLAEYQEKSLGKAVTEIGKVLSRDEMIAKVQSLALNQVKKGAMKSLACLQKVKADPTPASWRNQMAADMTRDLCMGLVSLVGAQAKGGFGGLAPAQPHKTAADNWNTGRPLADVNDTDTALIINNKVKAWGAVVKAVVADYSAHW